MTVDHRKRLCACHKGKFAKTGMTPLGRKAC